MDEMSFICPSCGHTDVEPEIYELLFFKIETGSHRCKTCDYSSSMFPMMPSSEAHLLIGQMKDKNIRPFEDYIEVDE